MKKLFKINAFLLWKLPAAFLLGVRIEEIDQEQCFTRVKYRWINANPFRSMYFAVQFMAAELATGALLLQRVSDKGYDVSMLVVSATGNFNRQARGRIRFRCVQGNEIDALLAKLGPQPETIHLKSTGTNADGELVSEFSFNWSIKKRQS